MKGRTLLYVILAAAVLLGGRHFGNAPVDARSATTVTLEVPEGSGARAIAQQLKSAGLLRSPFGFVARVLLAGKRGALQAGKYELSPRESGGVILGRLVRGETLPLDVSVTFPEGFTLEQIAARLEARGITGADAFRTAARADRFRGEFDILRNAPPGASLEGYLFPDTYRFARGAPVEEIVRRLLRRFTEQWVAATRDVQCPQEKPPTAYCPPASLPPTSPKLWRVRAGLLPTASSHEVVTMASIIEREVTTPEDRRLVSGILWKRLGAGVGLDADATIRYALNKWDGRLTVGDLRTDSPYNTRRYRGLPPGPIGNPGLDSLIAALTPQESAYLYYLSAADDKRTIFSGTLEEHNAAKAEHLR